MGGHDRWWLLPGETAARVHGRDLVFDYDDGTLWRFTLQGGEQPLLFFWDHHACGWDVSSQELSNALWDEVSEAVRKMSAPRPGWKLTRNEQAVVDAVAGAMRSDQWVSGRRIRASLKMRPPQFEPIARRLRPRYLQSDSGDRGDAHSLTLPGMLVSSEGPLVRRILQATISVLKSKFEADPDVRDFTLDEIVAEGRLSDDDRRLACAVIGVVRLHSGGGGGGGTGSAWKYTWHVPTDIEDLAYYDFQDLFEQSPREGNHRRCWPTAPIRLETVANQGDREVSQPSTEPPRQAPPSQHPPTETSATTVFISYSHDSGAHGQRVLALADQLRTDGLDVRLDQYDPHPPEGWAQWMTRQIVESDFVVQVCTPTYRRRYEGQEEPGVGRGVAWEAMVGRQLLYEAGARNEKQLPVLFEDGQEKDVPRVLRPYTYYRLPDRYEALYRRLTGQPSTPPPPIGTVKRLPPAPRPGFLPGARLPTRNVTASTPPTVDEAPSARPENTAPHRTLTLPEPKAASTAAPQTILLFTANAVYAQQRIQLEEELAKIDDALRRSRLRDCYMLRMSLAVTFTKVIHELDDHDPTFVHFSGHGDPTGELVLKGEPDGEMRVPPARVAELLSKLRTRPTLVTFATCHSRALAEAASQHAAFAIGFDGELEDESAQLFSATLYERLASRTDVEVRRAFELAQLACVSAGYVSVELAQLFEYPGKART